MSYENKNKKSDQLKQYKNPSCIIYQRILLSLCLARKIKEKCPEIIFVVGNDIIGFDFLCILFIPTIHNEWAHKEFSRIRADMENVGSKQQIN